MPPLWRDLRASRGHRGTLVGRRAGACRDTPAWVCDREGHVFYNSEILEQLDALQRDPPQARRTLAVPVYDFGQAHKLRRAAAS